MVKENIFMIQMNTIMMVPGSTIKKMATKANMLVLQVSIKANGKTEWLMEMVPSP